MDHEFFSSGLDKDEVGWDWLSLQLADNTELMLYRLRHKDGSVDPFSSGTYVDASGKSTFLSVRDFSMTPIGESLHEPGHESCLSNRVAGERTVARIGAATQDAARIARIGERQQRRACRTGRAPSTSAEHVAAAAIAGVGYLEMTGYAKPMTLEAK